VFVEYFAGSQGLFERYEQLRNLTPFLKVNADSKIVVEQQKLRNSRVASLQSYLIFQERLAAWMLSEGRFTLLEVTQHRHYVHSKIVPFAATYTWAAVVAFDHEFRVSQHLGTLTWLSHAPALVQSHLMSKSKAVDTALTEMRALTAKMKSTRPTSGAGGGRGSASTTTGRLSMENAKTAAGEDICIAFQLGKCPGNCGRAHVCHRCRMKASACTCKQHRRDEGTGVSVRSGAAATELRTVSEPASSKAGAAGA